MLGTSNGSCAIVEYAKSKGIYTIVTDNLLPEVSSAKKISDEYWMVSTSDLDVLEKKCRKAGINAVMSGASDYNVCKAIELCSRLGLPSFCDMDVWHYSVDKYDFKKICRKFDVPIPEDFAVSPNLSEEEISKVVFPVMVKPVDLSGNKGVSYCYCREDLKKAYKHALSVSASEKIIVERMLHGEEWYASYALARGNIRLLALNAMYSQPGEPKNCYTITTTVSNHVNQFIEEVNPKIEKLLIEGIGGKEGYCWVQLMHDADGKFYIIEMGYRLDGDMIFIPYKEVCGFDTIKFLVNYAIGHHNSIEDLPMSQSCAFKKCGCGMMLWTNKDGIISKIEGFQNLDIPGVVIDFRHKMGDTVKKHTSIGNIMFTADNCQQMCEMIGMVNRNIRILNENGEDIVIKYTDFDYLQKIYNEGLVGK